MSGYPLTIAEFCKAHRLSRSTFFRMVREHRAPEVMRLSARKVLISPEAAERWRQGMSRA